MNHVPESWEFVLLALGCFRLTRLVGYDDLTIPLRRWVTGMSDDQHHRYSHAVDQALQHDKPIPPLPVGAARMYLSKLIHCPWCSSVHVALWVYLAWLAWSEATLIAATPLALSSVVGLVSKNWDA